MISLNIDCHLGKVSETPVPATFIIPTICSIVFDSALILIVVLTQKGLHSNSMSFLNLVKILPLLKALFYPFQI